MQKKEGIETTLNDITETYSIPVAGSSNPKLMNESKSFNDYRNFNEVQNKEKRLKRTSSDSALDRKTTISPIKPKPQGRRKIFPHM